MIANNFQNFRKINRKKSKAPGSDKLFGKYDDLVRLVLGFLLTGVIGAYLSHTYTTQQADLSAAANIFSEHSKLIGDRYFSMHQVTVTMNGDKSGPVSDQQAEVKAAWGKYREILQEWNSIRGFNREMIKLYFGDPIWNTERNIHYQFRSWGLSLEAEKQSPGSVDFKCLSDKKDALLSTIHKLRVDMATALLNGDVGRLRTTAPAKLDKKEEAWCM